MALPIVLAALSRDQKWYLGVVGIVACVVVAAYWATRVFNDLKGEEEECLTETMDLLGPLSQAYEAGQMSEEEFRRIQRSVINGKDGGSIRETDGRPAPVAEAGTSPVETPDGA